MLTHCNLVITNMLFSLIKVDLISKPGDDCHHRFFTSETKAAAHTISPLVQMHLTKVCLLTLFQHPSAGFNNGRINIW